ncbi:MAG: hypothetical protein KBS59_03795 [Clostridiales bacterium]|nr:hypothetical protein [Clostridiales bacterium]
MTNREFFTAIASNSTLSAELVEFATEAIAKLDKRNETRSSKPSKTAIANEPIKASILEFIGDKKDVLSADIAVALDISVNKASSLCVQMVKDGVLTSSDVKVPKKGKCKGYSLTEEAGE